MNQPTDKLAVAVDQAPLTFKMIDNIANTEMIPAGLRGKPKAIVACILTGREFGLGPMESLRLIDVIDGKPSPAGELMLRMVKERGHRVKLLELNETKCRLAGIRGDNPDDVMEIEFTWKDAERAGLTNKNNWKKYPKHMLYWRAVSMLTSFQFPDAIGGRVYVADELGSEEWVEDIDPEVIEVKADVILPNDPDDDLEDDIIEAVIVEDSDKTAETPENEEETGIPIPPEDSSHDEIGVEEATLNLENAGLIDTEDETWSELYALAALTDQGAGSGTMKDLEARTRHLYQLCEKVGLWKLPDGAPYDDVLHLALQHHDKVDHWSNLGNKAERQAFCVWSFQKVRADLKKMAQQEA